MLSHRRRLIPPTRATDRSARSLAGRTAEAATSDKVKPRARRIIAVRLPRMIEDGYYSPRA